MAKRKFTNEQLQIMSEYDFIKLATEKRVSFTYEFRCELWEAFGENIRPGNIRSILKDKEFPVEFFSGTDVLYNLARQIRRDGQPSRGTNKTAYVHVGTWRASENGNNTLLATGKFVKLHRGISFSDDFKKELYIQFPQISVKEGLKAAGIDPDLVGYQRIYALEQEFNHLLQGDSPAAQGPVAKDEVYSAEIVKKYSDHPLVEKITKKQIRFRSSFWQAASLIPSEDVTAVLSVLGFDCNDFSMGFLYRLRQQLLSHNAEDSAEEVPGPMEYQIAVWKRLSDYWEKTVLEQRDKITEKLNSCSVRRELCLMIRDLCEAVPSLSVRSALSWYGISKSSYYYILSHDSYGEMKEEDQHRCVLIREIFESGGFKKGSRQVSMQLNHEYPKYAAGRKKVARLMKKMGLECPVRRGKRNRKDSRNLIDRNIRPNLLDRRFRLARPMTHILTDVTYLDYGNGQRAYKSSVKDAVTGRTLASVIRSTNDSELTEDTLKQLKQYTFSKDAIFHSDQGILYFQDSFQDELKEMGLIHSMSRRGVCHDNAPQESYFGHFKDECDYSSCQTLEELQELDRKYEHYYNFIRRMDSRNQMTPVEYEEYLMNMNEEEFGRYLEKEERIWEQMKEDSRQAAIDFARSQKQMKEKIWQQEKEQRNC